MMSGADSPFHAGERAIQSRLGVRQRLEDVGKRIIRDHLPEQHRTFYEQLPFLLIGHIDDRGRPWASILAGQPGFVQTPDAHTLSINAPRIAGGPLARDTAPGARIAVLGIQYDSRRRNRVTGRITTADDHTIVVRVDQAFGNCPKYIHARAIEPRPGGDDIGGEARATALDHFSERARTMIQKADHLFIATYFSQDPHDVTHGADVSHRGGKPGFVRIESDRTFVFPDFSGNSHFNTLGNIVSNPQAGLLFIDFDAGDLLYLTCTAEIVWDGREKRAFAGAERLLRLTLRDGTLLERALPLRSTFLSYSPHVAKTGSWPEVEAGLSLKLAR
jgi:predicted pyridoxine 5'-phosphate oxidase superfamily flavin-nucleotide-binding protein